MSRQEKEKGPAKHHRYESDMTRKEKREIEKEKLSTMSIGGKLGYIWTYYKGAMAAILGVILLIVVILQLVENSKYHTILNVSVVDAQTMEEQSKIQDELQKQFGTKNKYDQITFDTSYMMGEDVEKADYNTVMKFTTVIAAKDMDVLITTQNVYNHYKEQEMFLDLSSLFTPEECEKLGISKGTDMLDITNTPWLEKHKWVQYEPVYLTVISNTQNQDKVKEFITAVEEEK
ncbi:hypothetical protein INP51_02325 [Blautia liquoris]|uniref:Uncharacterized protein n=1 Tax=Blautia liquoris TaxID=2779518 RepID=A0A7M2RHL9_9FIRM|nr:hypothetical protein [Blautia liquoris]QOV19833.1 hypothetical protein INP51_02325 [Blautia liquoris]